MLYQFLLNFVDIFGFLNVFKYLTFRTGLSVFTSLVIVLIIGGPFIKFFSNQKIFNPIYERQNFTTLIKAQTNCPPRRSESLMYGNNLIQEVSTHLIT